MRDNDRLATLAGRFGQPVVARIAVELQCPVEPGQERLGVFTVAPGGVEIYHPRRIIAAPTPVIARQGPEVSGFGPPAARVQHRRRPPVSGKLSAALLFLYFTGGRDRMMTWDIHRNAR